MGPKSIQDITPPVESEVSSTGPSAPKAPILQAAPVSESASGVEIVSDIPVRAPTAPSNGEQKLQLSKGDSLGLSVPAASLSAASKEDKQKPKAKDSKSQPTLAVAVALTATIFLVVGAYLKFFSSS